MEERCRFCSDFNEENEDMTIEQIKIGEDGYFNYECPMKYCPNCGKILNKYKIEK